MPTLREIFGNAINNEDTYIVVRDRKPTQCSYIDNIEEVPFIKRCTNVKMHTRSVCPYHAYAVNYLDGRGIERTAYFDTMAKAEHFKRNNNWLECNYDARTEKVSASSRT